MSEAQSVASIAKWAQVRVRGRARFVLVWGLGLWGGLMFALMALGFAPMLLGARALEPRILLASALLWAAGGVFFGFAAWHFNEKAFHKHRAVQAGTSA